MEKSESIKELAISLCKFQKEVEKIKKTETNPFFRSSYASLSSILDVIREPLSNNGLSFVQFPKGTNELETMLMHTSGEWMTGSYEMKPQKNDPQGLGSAITYQRRYALGAILGLNIDDDDDGNSASTPPKKTAKDDGKKWLNPNTTDWTNTVGKLKAKTITIEVVEKHYKMSKENKEKLINESK